MVRRARDLGPPPNVTFQVGDGASLAGIDDASVDLVLSFTVFQHIPDIEVIDGYLAEAGRILRPGGVAAFQWNNEPGHRGWSIRRGALGLLQRTGLHAERYRRHAPEFLGSRVPLARIDAALARAGLERVGLRNEGTLFTWAWARRG